MKTRYDQMWKRLEQEGQGAFIPFLTLGDPSRTASARLLRALVDGGADALELGIPFSDPTADGPTIQKAAVRAMKAGTTPNRCWDLIRSVRHYASDIPIGLLVYANLVFSGGVDNFYQQARDAGVDSVLVADVPVAEVAMFAESARAHDVAPVLIAPPNADEAKLRRIAETGQGYTYVVTRSGVTGTRDEVTLENREIATLLRELGAPPPVFGFGISRPEHVKAALTSGAAGAISGSAIVRKVEENLDDISAAVSEVQNLVAKMKSATTIQGDNPSAHEPPS